MVAPFVECGQGVLGGAAVVVGEQVEGHPIIGVPFLLLVHQAQRDALLDQEFRQGGHAGVADAIAEHAVRGRAHRGGGDQVGCEHLDVRPIEEVLNEASEAGAGIPIRLFEAGAHGRIEQAFVGDDGVGAHGLEQGAGEVAIGDLDRVGPDHHVRIGGVVGECREHRGELAGGRAAELFQGIGGLAAHPIVGIREPAAEGGQRGGGQAQAERFAGTHAGIGIRPFRHGDQIVFIGGRQRAVGQLIGGVVADHRIVVAQIGHQAGNRIVHRVAAIEFVGGGGDAVCDLGGVQRVGGVGIAAGDAEALQRDSVAQEIPCGGDHAAIVFAGPQISAVRGGTRAVLFAAIIDKRPVRAAFQVEVPADVVEVGGNSGLAAEIGAQGTPQVTEPLAGVAVFAAGAAGGAHAGEIFRFRRAVVLQAEHHRTHRILAVGRVIDGIRFMFAIRNRSLVDIPTEKIRRAGDRRIDLGIDRQPAC